MNQLLLIIDLSLKKITQWAVYSHPGRRGNLNKKTTIVVCSKKKLPQKKSRLLLEWGLRQQLHICMYKKILEKDSTYTLHTYIKEAENWKASKESFHWVMNCKTENFFCENISYPSASILESLWQFYISIWSIQANW